MRCSFRRAASQIEINRFANAEASPPKKVLSKKVIRKIVQWVKNLVTQASPPLPPPRHNDELVTHSPHQSDYPPKMIFLGPWSRDRTLGASLTIIKYVRNVKRQKKIPPCVTVDKERPMRYFWTQPTSTRQELRLRQVCGFRDFLAVFVSDMKSLIMKIYSTNVPRLLACALHSLAPNTHFHIHFCSSTMA